MTAPGKATPNIIIIIIIIAVALCPSISSVPATNRNCIETAQGPNSLLALDLFLCHVIRKFGYFPKNNGTSRYLASEN